MIDTPRSTLPAVLLAGLLALLPAHAEPPADDPVRTKLDARGVAYEVDADGDYKIVYSWQDEGRSQLVFVSGLAQEIDGLRIREVFAPAARVDGEGLDAALANALLRDSRDKKLGAWELDGSVLYFVIKLPETIDAANLETALSAAAEVADNREIELSGDADEL